MVDRIKKFVDEISAEKVNSNTINQYSLDWDITYGFTARNNLLCYLTTMLQEIKPKTLLLGEAPGHKGCKLTGVPFTSEYIIGSGKYKLFGYTEETKAALKMGKINPQKEATATIIWEALERLEIYPLMWNAYPFYPHDNINDKPNRKPKPEEIDELGKKYFNKLIELIPVENFVAVGNVAEKTLKRFGIANVHCIPHPSYGNKSKFIEGLEQLQKINII